MSRIATVANNWRNMMYARWRNVVVMSAARVLGDRTRDEIKRVLVVTYQRSQTLRRCQRLLFQIWDGLNITDLITRFLYFQTSSYPKQVESVAKTERIRNKVQFTFETSFTSLPDGEKKLDLVDVSRSSDIKAFGKSSSIMSQKLYLSSCSVSRLSIFFIRPSSYS